MIDHGRGGGPDERGIVVVEGVSLLGIKKLANGTILNLFELEHRFHVLHMMAQLAGADRAETANSIPDAMPDAQIQAIVTAVVAALHIRG